MRIACGLNKRGKEKREKSTTSITVTEEECEGTRENLPQLMFDLSNFTLHDYWGGEDRIIA
jgi:hypothetical protein